MDGARTDAQIESKLRALEQELLALIEQTTAGAAPVDLDEPIGRLSRMEAMQQQAMTAANRRGSELRLQMVRSALTRLAREDYGECLSCGEDIAPRRLEARPETPLCLNCASARERA